MCPCITRHEVSNELRRQAKRGIDLISTSYDTEVNIVPAAAKIAIIPAPHKRPKKLGGRPVGSTDGKKVVDEMLMMKVKNILFFEK